MPGTVPKPKPSPQPAGEQPKPPLISYRPSREVNDALEEYRQRFDYAPDKTAVIERAMRRFLAAEGFENLDEDE